MVLTITCVCMAAWGKNNAITISLPAVSNNPKVYGSPPIITVTA